MDNLIRHIGNYVPLTQKEATILEKGLKVIKLEKNHTLLREGEVCRYNHFVSQGCLRMYFIKENGTEQITQFAIENWWMADYLSLMNQVPSSFYIETIEPTNIIKVDNETADELFLEVPQLERYFRLISQRAYAAAQLRIKYLYDLSREELFLHFSERFPEFMQRVPQYMMASYLGFTPEYFSKLRKKTR